MSRGAEGRGRGKGKERKERKKKPEEDLWSGTDQKRLQNPHHVQKQDSSHPHLPSIPHKEKLKRNEDSFPPPYQLPLTRELLLSQTRPKLASGHALWDFILPRAGQAPNSFSSLEGAAWTPTPSLALNRPWARVKAGSSVPEVTSRLATAKMCVGEGERTNGAERRGKEGKFHLEVRGSERPHGGSDDLADRRGQWKGSPGTGC